MACKRLRRREEEEEEQDGGDSFPPTVHLIVNAHPTAAKAAFCLQPSPKTSR